MNVVYKMGEHFNKSQCVNMTDPADHCKYYGLKCGEHSV